MVKINKEQRIVNVIFIVEGKKTETKIIRDNFENLNKTIFNKTEKFYEQNSYFKILSLLLVSLLDLGLVEI